MEKLLKDLNEAQRKAVMNYQGPSMVLAGAGSGKTRVLTYRVAYLVAMGVDPFRILALTFTNKAAREMKERIMTLVGTEAMNVWMGTFHSIFARLLRIDGHLLGYTSRFTIYDTEDSKRLIRSIVKEMELDPKVYQQGYILHRISSAKTAMVSARMYNEDPERMQADHAGGKPRIGEIYLQYQQRLKKADAMDFDDLLFNMNILLDKFPEIMLKYQRKFEYILVDEYQDTNVCQYLIIKKLAANNENICVVGDDAQSIYAFRGANIQNILNFRKDYPDHQVFKLEQNYRSTKNIVAAANSVIEYNKDQIFKKIWTENDEGLRLRLIRAKSDTEEGTLVVNAIFELKMNQQLGNHNFAILYRTNAQSRSFEESLRRLNIPYRIYGGLSFYQRKEIKDLLAYFRLAINHHDEEALMRVVNYPARGIGQTTMERVVVKAREKDVSAWDVVNDPFSYALEVNAPTRQRLINFATMIRSFAAQMESKSAYDLGRLIANNSGLFKDLQEDSSPEGISRIENIEELLNAISEFMDSPAPEPEEGEVPKPFRTLDEFMQDVALLTDADEKDKEDRNHVSLMTIHAAKGLEFPHVFIVGMEENLFPSFQSLNNRSDLEEERRLFYVAITRGMQSVTLSYAENRYRWGDLISSDPSRFIDEIDPKFLEVPKKVRISGFDEFRNVAGLDSPELNSKFQIPNPRQNSNFRQKTGSKQSTTPKHIPDPKNLKKLSSFSKIPSPNSGGGDDLEGLQVGMEVEHQRFGKGKVIGMEGSGHDRKATVFFPAVGQKQLLLRFAKLRIL